MKKKVYHPLPNFAGKIQEILHLCHLDSNPAKFAPSIFATVPFPPSRLADRGIRPLKVS